MTEPYAMTRLDALRKLRREGYHVVAAACWQEHVAGRVERPSERHCARCEGREPCSPMELWQQAGREHRDGPAIERGLRYRELMIQHGHLIDNSSSSSPEGKVTP